MCNPAALQGLQIGGAAAGVLGQSRSASAQTDALMRNNDAQMAAVSDQYAENRAVTTNKMAQRSREAMIERARLTVLGNESGLGGNTGYRLQNESSFNLGQDLALLNEEKQRTDKQIHRNAQGIANTTQSRLSSVKQPDYVGAGLQIAGGYLDSRTTQRRLDAKANS